MDSFKAKLICTLLAFGLIVGAVIGLGFYYLLPQYYPTWYPQMLVFFLASETLIVNYVVSASNKATDRQLLNTYMLTKVVKIFLALFFVGIYAFTVKVEIKNFVLVFMLLYILFLVIESYLFTKIEKRLKQKKQQEE